MKKKKIIEVSLTSILVIILLFVLTGSLNKITQNRLRVSQGTKEQVNFKEQKTSQNLGLPMKSPVQELLKKQEKESNNLELKRDPFNAVPIISIQRSSSSPHLNGILWDKNSPMAIINNVVVKIGDRVSDKVVIDIKQNEVILSDGARNIELRLGE